MNQGITLKKLAISMAILAGVFVFASCSKKQPEPQDNPQNNDQNQQDQQGIKQGEDMENWQTYQNDEYGFEFKYPQDWEVQESREETNAIFSGFLLRVRPKEINDENKDLVFYVEPFRASEGSKDWFNSNIENVEFAKNVQHSDRIESEIDTKELEINDMDVYFVDKIGGIKDERIINDVYYVLSKNNNLILLVQFRTEDIPSNEIRYSYEEYLPYFENLVNSVR